MVSVMFGSSNLLEIPRPQGVGGLSHCTLLVWGPFRSALCPCLPSARSCQGPLPMWNLSMGWRHMWHAHVRVWSLLSVLMTGRCRKPNLVGFCELSIETVSIYR